MDDLYRVLTAEQIGRASRIAIVRRAQRVELELRPAERASRA
jgi:hypothetical protein